MPPAWCLLAENTSRTYYRFARLQAMSEWWHWLVLLAVCAAVMAFVASMYWRDSVDLRRGVAWSLVLLRIAAFAGILFFFLDLEKRTEEREIKPSRAILLVDISQSMGLRDTDQSGKIGPSRIHQVVAELRRGELVSDLRKRHDVAVYRFDQQAAPAQIAFYKRYDDAMSSPAGIERAVADRRAELTVARTTVAVAGGLVGVALLSLIIYLVVGRGGPQATSWTLFVSVAALLAGVIGFAVAQLRSPELPVRALTGLVEPDFDAVVRAELARRQAAQAGDRANAAETGTNGIDWQTELVPTGSETRIGDTVKAVVRGERGGPIAGIVILTDGRNNAGIDCSVAAAAAENAGIPIYAVGIGSDRRPINVRVVDLEAPKRVYPGDHFTLTGYLQAFGMAGKLTTVQLTSTPAEGGAANADAASAEMFEEERSVRLPPDGEVLTLRFEVTPEETGARRYRLSVAAPDQDIEPRDNTRSARVQILERKTRVLLIAGGPTREYRFLRNLLYRDKDVTVDVWLQIGAPGISQEADDVLFEFPQLADELFEYDCIVAFDPDWTQLDEGQTELLDRWVAEQAGGLIVVAGPVYTPEWTSVRRGRDPRLDVIKGLYPVVFYSQGSPSMSLGRFGGELPWPLDFTRDGQSAEFLWLEDDPLDSEAAWKSFEGVYGYYAVKDPKPGARVYARFSNPDTSIDAELPIYMAGQFYGAGRVFFQASGEMWRLRAVEERYFETYYTKLIRWVSQGRLSRDSSRGVLLVDKDRCLLGDRVTVRAILNDAQHQPLTLPLVPAILVHPDSTRQPLPLQKVKDAARDGMYEAQFNAIEEGDYRIELTPPQSVDEELLTTEVRVRVPALEMEHPQRDDARLKQLSESTRGEYFIGFDAAMRRAGNTRATLASAIAANDQVVYMPESINTQFESNLMGWLIGLICGTLCLEWLIRRLSKLA